MGLIWIGAALAQECPAPLAPDELSARLDQVKEGVLFGEPAAAEELSRLEAQLPCLDGPVDRADLARLMQSQGAYALFLGQDPKNYLARAAVLGEPADPDYGPQFAQAMVQAAPQETAYLDLDFQPVPSVLFVDGQIQYDTGPQQVAAGWHIVQWMEDDGSWETRVLELGPGGRERIQVQRAGAAPPVAVTSPPQSVEPEPAGEARMVLNAGLGYQLARASYLTGPTTWTGMMGAPALSVAFHTAGTWHARADANLVPWATGARSGGSNRVAVGGGWQQTQDKRLFLAPAALIAGASRPVAWSTDVPVFEPDLAFGGSLLVGLQPADKLDLSLALEGLQTGVGARLGAHVGLPEIAGVPLWVGASGNTFRGSQGDRLSWAQVGVGGTLGI